MLAELFGLEAEETEAARGVLDGQSRKTSARVGLALAARAGDVLGLRSALAAASSRSALETVRLKMFRKSSQDSNSVN